MSIRVNVKKHYKHVLPKVKGHHWWVHYRPDETHLGNMRVVLWRNGLVGDIVGSSNVQVNPSDHYVRAQRLVRLAAEQALQEAINKGVQFKWGKPVAPDNITGKSK